MGLLDHPSSFQEMIMSDLSAVARRRRRRWAHAPAINMPLAMLTMKKELREFLVLCMHVVLFPKVMMLRLATLWAARALL